MCHWVKYYECILISELYCAVAELHCGHFLRRSSDVMLLLWLMQVVEEASDELAVSKMILSTIQGDLQRLRHSLILSLLRCHSLHLCVCCSVKVWSISKVQKHWQHSARYLYSNFFANKESVKNHPQEFVFSVLNGRLPCVVYIRTLYVVTCVLNMVTKFDFTFF